MSSIFEKVVYPDGDPNGNPGDDVIVWLDGAPHRIYQGFAIACSNLVVRPLFLGPADRSSIGSYNGDLDYMCLQWADPADFTSKWFCGAGELGDGVVGIASTGNSPRTFFVKNLAWAANTWDHHWEWASILAPVARRIDPALRTGFALNGAWNLNPRDFHTNGTSKGPDYIAGIALKTTTNRSGVRISVYNTRNVQQYAAANPGVNIDTLALAALNPSELNQGEVETYNCGSSAYPSPGCTDYFTGFDLLSNGRIGDGTNDLYGVVDLTASQGYYNLAHSNPVQCSWQTDWNLPIYSAVDIPRGINWAANSSGTSLKSLRLANTAFRLSVHRGAGEISRCPTWSLCSGASSTTAHNVALIAFDEYWNKLPGVRDYPWDGSYLRFGNPPYDTHVPCQSAFVTSDACEDFMCGQPVPAVTANGAPVDWYVCSGGSCRDYSNTSGWQLACQGTATCRVTMAGDDTYIVSLPVSFRADIAVHPDWLTWSVNYGL